MAAVCSRPINSTLPSIRVNVAEHGVRRRKGWVHCELDSDVKFSTRGMESYFFSAWDPVVYDAMLVGAAADFCDRTRLRPTNGWGRELEVRVPVHEPDRWNDKDVSDALHEALEFLTGDRWSFMFYERREPLAAPRQGLINLGSTAVAVLPFSDGLDSRAVAGLIENELGAGLVRVRLGSRGEDGRLLSRERKPFTSVPFKVTSPAHNCEPTARTRGFKFNLISGVAAYLAKVERIVLPESGQGALGPMLVPVGQAYVDYRNHPLFTKKMERFFMALFDHKVRFEFPRLWHTKAETLEAFIEQCGDRASSWGATRSCWQQNRHVSVNGKARQCGICAACMLRRVSVHAADLTEPDDTYVWEDLSAATLEAGAANDFGREKITRAMHEHAIAGTLHLDHLAAVHHSPANKSMLDLCAFQLSRSCELSVADVRARLERLLNQHETEWKDFMRSLGPSSFVTNWAVQTREYA